MRVAMAVAAMVVLAGCQGPRVMSVCEISRDYPGWQGREVAVRGVYFDGLREECTASCAAGPWPSFLNLVGGKDGVWEPVEPVIRQAEREGVRGEIWVTVRGRLEANRRRSPAGPCDRVMWYGFGHLGAFPAQIEVTAVEDVRVVARADSPYDYRKRPRGAL